MSLHHTFHQPQPATNKNPRLGPSLLLAQHARTIPSDLRETETCDRIGFLRGTLRSCDSLLCPSCVFRRTGHHRECCSQGCGQEKSTSASIGSPEIPFSSKETFRFQKLRAFFFFFYAHDGTLLSRMAEMGKDLLAEFLLPGPGGEGGPRCRIELLEKRMVVHHKERREGEGPRSQ